MRTRKLHFKEIPDTGGDQHNASKKLIQGAKGRSPHCQSPECFCDIINVDISGTYLSPPIFMSQNKSVSEILKLLDKHCVLCGKAIQH